MKIAINPGHTLRGAGYGAVGFLTESLVNREVYSELVPIIRAAGHEVVECVVDSAPTQSAYLKQAVDTANNAKADLFVSIHFNASVNHNAGGTAVYVYGGKQYPEAVKCCANIASLGFRNRGIWDGSNLYVLRHTAMKAILLEICFVDYEPDADLYRQVGPKAVAEAIARALVGEIPTEEHKAGWVLDETGWWYRDADGSYPKSEWREINGQSYYFKEDGYMATGWVEYNGNWYYFDPNMGNMVTGWLLEDEKWYYLVPGTGIMVRDTTYTVGKETFAFGEDGAMIEGDDLHYYTDDRGALHMYKPSEPETDDGEVAFEG